MIQWIYLKRFQSIQYKCLKLKFWFTIFLIFLCWLLPFQISIHEVEGRCLIVMKGAPERILARCSKIFIDGTTKEMTDEYRTICDKACTQLAEKGERVLGFCDLLLDEQYNKDFKFCAEPANFPRKNLRFVGFMALIDPPRPQVPDAVDRCRMAGIRVVMVTGDHPVNIPYFHQFFTTWKRH